MPVRVSVDTRIEVGPQARLAVKLEPRLEGAEPAKSQAPTA
ncbi:MAG: hypothetical protein ACR2OC_08390 [Solirubrobacterales bacterium]